MMRERSTRASRPVLYAQFCAVYTGILGDVAANVEAGKTRVMAGGCLERARSLEARHSVSVVKCAVENGDNE
jgi:hypothetical protein